MKPARRVTSSAPTSSLKARAEALRAELAKAIRPPASLPPAGSPEARAAFKAAVHEHSLRQGFEAEYPELSRALLPIWTTEALGRAMRDGEITPAECARLSQRASEREFRMAALEHELNLHALFALAFAAEFPSTTPDDADKITPPGSSSKH